MNSHFRDPFETVRPLMPALPWHWAVWGAVGGMLAVAFAWSLGWCYTHLRAQGKSPGRALGTTLLAAISWPLTVAIIAVLYPPARRVPTAVRRSRRFWVVLAGAAGTTIVVCALIDHELTTLVLFFMALTPVFLAFAPLWLSTLALSLVLAHSDSIPGIAAWGVIVLGMLAFTVWRERRTRPQQTTTASLQHRG